jgi:hypothetical protein
MPERSAENGAARVALAGLRAISGLLAGFSCPSLPNCGNSGLMADRGRAYNGMSDREWGPAHRLVRGGILASNLHLATSFAVLRPVWAKGRP